MESGEIMEGEEPIAKKESNNPELVCIRKRLADPNKILPGLMPRSRLPIHLLPVQAHC